MKSLREQIAGSCKHFTGVQNKTCEVGVGYASLRDASGQRAAFATMPCFAGEGRAACVHREFPTEAEVEAEIAEADASFGRIRKAREAIVASKLQCGSIRCPCCGKDGALRFSIAPGNGHIHAACSSGCVSWME